MNDPMIREEILIDARQVINVGANEHKFSRFDHFIFSVVILVLLPLSPLGLEGLFSPSNEVSEQSVALVGILYAISLAIASRIPILILVKAIACVMLSITYGVMVSSQNGGINLREFAWAMVIFMAAVHLMERIYQQLVKGFPFINISIRWNSN